MQNVKPIDDNLRFGELNPDGSIKRNVFVCAISGQPIEPGDVMMAIPDTRLFYRVKAPLMWEQHREQYEAAHLELVERAKAFGAVDTKPIIEVKPTQTSKGVDNAR